MFPRHTKSLFNRLISQLLGMTGRASRLDLDSAAARDFNIAPSAQPFGKPQLRLIEGGLAHAKPNAPSPRHPQPTARRHG